MMRPLPEMGILTAQATSPDQFVSVSVYDIAVSNGTDAMYTISNALSNYGMSIEFEMEGNNVYGKTYASNGTFTWVGKAIRKNGGIRPRLSRHASTRKLSIQTVVGRPGDDSRQVSV